MRCREGLVFFSFVIDVFSRKVVGSQLASTMRTTLVLDALRYTQTLNDHQVLGSIGTVGDAYDNALAESLVDTFKTELIKDRVWRFRPQMELAIVQYIAWFNSDRLHESLGDIPPEEPISVTPGPAQSSADAN